jgi:hypothetical protein
MTAFWVLIPTFHRNVLPPYSGCIIIRYRSSYLVSKPKRLTFENLLSRKIKNLLKCTRDVQWPRLHALVRSVGNSMVNCHSYYIFSCVFLCWVTYMCTTPSMCQSLNDINLHIRCCTCMLLTNKHIMLCWYGVKNISFTLFGYIFQNNFKNI